MAKSNYFSNTQTFQICPTVDGIRSTVAYSTSMIPLDFYRLRMSPTGLLEYMQHRCQLFWKVRNSHGIVGHVPCPARIPTLSRIFWRLLLVYGRDFRRRSGNETAEYLKRSVILIRRR